MKIENSKFIMTKKQTQRRYRLHYRIRKQGYRLNTKQKTIYVNHLMPALSRQVVALQTEFGYGIQTEI